MAADKTIFGLNNFIDQKTHKAKRGGGSRIFGTHFCFSENTAEQVHCIIAHTHIVNLTVQYIVHVAYKIFAFSRFSNQIL